MTFLVPLTLFGWIVVSIILFIKYSAPTAILCSVIGGFLFLPVTTYDLPGIPEYTKDVAIAFGLILGGILSGKRNLYKLQINSSDMFMIIWCFISPVATSLSNGLGLYDGISSMMRNYLNWGVYFWAGRRYFISEESLKEISKGLIIGGLIYVPLIIYELRMSPQLSNIFYGFFPHDWIQHVRYGGYRPIVFMEHGLMVALWMSAAFILAFWTWKSGKLEKIKNIPMGYVALILFTFALLCKSANGWSAVTISLFLFFHLKKNRNTKVLKLFFLSIPLYIISRGLSLVSSDFMLDALSNIFDQDRIFSLGIRLNQENLFTIKALARPLFGWGGWQRSWPIDPATGQIISVVDSLWIIVLSTYGIIGIVSLFGGMLVGPWKILKKHRVIMGLSENVYEIALSLIVILFMIDSLLNGMVNPVYILISGALLSNSQREQQREVDISPALS